LNFKPHFFAQRNSSSTTTMRIHHWLLFATGIALCSGQLDDRDKQLDDRDKKPAAIPPWQPTGTPTPAPESWYGQDDDTMSSSYGLVAARMTAEHYATSNEASNDVMRSSNELDMYDAELLAIEFESDTADAIRASLGGSSTTLNVNGNPRRQLTSRRRVRDCTGPETKGDLKSPPEAIVAAAVTSTALARSSTALVPTSTELVPPSTALVTAVPTEHNQSSHRRINVQETGELVAAATSPALVPTSTALAVSVLLGLNPNDIVDRTFNEIVDTVLPLGRTQDELVGVIRSHGGVD
jgi:hypothetical protein